MNQSQVDMRLVLVTAGTVHIDMSSQVPGSIGDRSAVNVVDVFDRYTSPLWYVIGMPGNVAACVVWIQSRLRHSSGFYLAALAVNDFCFLVLHVSHCLTAMQLYS
jgi:hypothetical protein